METCNAAETIGTEGEPSCGCEHDREELIANPQMAIIEEEKKCGSSSCLVAAQANDKMKPPEIIKNHIEWTNDDDLPSWSELTGEPQFKLGIVVNEATTTDIHLSSIGKPASSCEVARLVVLKASPKNENTPSSILKGWLEANNVECDSEGISVGWGESGYEDLLKSPSIDAVYIIVPPGSERQYILKALKAGKHVLLRDPLSTSFDEFTEQLAYAKKYQKFIQFSTMFVHQYRVRRFMDQVLREDIFGRIHNISASLQVNYDELEKVGVNLPITGPHNGCIRVLGRFCVLVTTLMFSRLGSTAISAKVHHAERGSKGEFISAECSINFTKNRTLKFDVGYINFFTRQSIEAKTESRYATMTDFVIEHPDGLATYRLYEKEKLPDGKLVVVSGEAIDVGGGFSQDVMMWRTFVQLSDSIDKNGWGDGNETSVELANVALQTKRILLALLKSAENNFETINLTDVESS